MNTGHLRDEQLLSLLCGEADGELKEHVAACQVCQRELAAWQKLTHQAATWKPNAFQRFWVRQKVWLRLFPALFWRLALPVAAAVVAVVLLVRPVPPAAGNVDAVLEEVDSTLASDPLAVVEDAQVLSVVLPEQTTGERRPS